MTALSSTTEPETADPIETPDPGATPDLALQVEAILITTDRPLASKKLAKILGHAAAHDVDQAIERLNTIYAETDRSFRVERIAGGWQIHTLPTFREILAAHHRARGETRLTPAAIETLAIIAYRQPILRADIESIRGVASGEVVRGLMDRKLVKIVGRAEELGRPMLYGTTRQFLELFGLADLKDLPKIEELQGKA